MNCKICGKEINFKDSDICEECSSKIDKLNEEYKKLKLRKIIIIIVLIILSFAFIDIFMKSLNKEHCRESLFMNQEQKYAYNNQFQSYGGKQQTGTNVKTLISKIIANNKTYEYEPEDYLRVKVCVTNAVGIDSNVYTKTEMTMDTADLTSLYNSIIVEKQYTIEIVIGDDGIVNGIKITQE